MTRVEKKSSPNPNMQNLLISGYDLSFYGSYIFPICEAELMRGT